MSHEYQRGRIQKNSYLGPKRLAVLAERLEERDVPRDVVAMIVRDDDGVMGGAFVSNILNRAKIRGYESDCESALESM